MKKIEIIWRDLLFQAIEKRNRRFTQKDLAEKFGFSTSTVFQALKAPRKMGAVRVTGRFFVLEDPEKLLYHWASCRNLKKDLIFSGRVDQSVSEIEAQMPPEAVFGGYAAANQVLAVPPADYDQVFAYAQTKNFLAELNKRFSFTKGRANLFILAGDNFLKKYGSTTPLAQTFVDLWNLGDWYAKEYTRALKEKIDAILS